MAVVAAVAAAAVIVSAAVLVAAALLHILDPLPDDSAPIVRPELPVGGSTGGR